MIAEFLVALALHATADAGVPKKKPTAAQLSSPKTTADAGTKSSQTVPSLDGGVKATASMQATDGGVKTPTQSVDAGVATTAQTAAKKTEMAPEVKALVDRMQAFYERTGDFTANFQQAYAYKASKRTVKSSGTVVFKKP